MRPAKSSSVLLLLLGGLGCDLFSDAVPCAVDSDCVPGVCVDGFCAAGEEGEGEEGEGEEGEGEEGEGEEGEGEEGEGEEGEGEEGEGEDPGIHPLRGGLCDDIGALHPSDPFLVCSIFRTFEQPCLLEGSTCRDPAASVCVDVGAGLPICAPAETVRRNLCSPPGDPTSDFDANDASPGACIEGNLVFSVARACGSSAVAFSGPDKVGGNIFVDLGAPIGSTPCATLTNLSFGTTVVGDSFVVLPIGDAAPLSLVIANAPDLVTVFGDYRVEGSPSITDVAAFDLKRIGRNLVIGSNDVLTEVAFDQLDVVGGDLVIVANPALTSVRATPFAIGGQVVIDGSPLLRRCSVEALVATAARGGTLTGLSDDPCD